VVPPMSGYTAAKTSARTTIPTAPMIIAVTLDMAVVYLCESWVNKR
jgi:hypothetical protein